MSPKLVYSAALSVVLAAMSPYEAHAEVSEARPAATAAPKASVGELLYSADNRKVAAIYRVYDDGRAGVIVGGKLVVIPAETIQKSDGKIKTTLSYRDLVKLSS